jgi:hypothetical protein
MSAEEDFILSALADALAPGEISAPEALLAAAASDPDPIAALSDPDRENVLFSALTGEYGFLDWVRRTHVPPAKEMRERIVGVLRWAIGALRDWRLDEDPRREQLASIFVVTQYCGHAGEIWKHFPPEVANEMLCHELASLLRRMRINVSTRGFSRRPISDAEAIAELNRADEAGDWPALADHLRHLDDRGSPRTIAMQAAQYLHRFFPDAFVEVISSARQTLFVAQLLEPFSGAVACEIALRSGNPYAEFVVTYRYAARDRTNKGESEEPHFQTLMSDLLVKVALDAPRWISWVQAFCRYPQYFPSIAKALGLALARVPANSIGSYTDAITLTSMRSVGRTVVGETLAAFRKEASIEQRKALWKRAFDRWEEWRFGAHMPGIAFHQIAFSELDYAIVGYALECMSENQRQQELADIKRKLGGLVDQWFRTSSDFGKEKYVLLSRCQPFAHATTAPADWLATRAYLPYDPEKDRYAAFVFGII